MESRIVPSYHAVAFPSKELTATALAAEKVLVVELSNGQMVDDVRLTLNGQRPIDFYGA